MNVTNQNQSLVKSELRHYFIRLAISNIQCTLRYCKWNQQLLKLNCFKTTTSFKSLYLKQILPVNRWPFQVTFSCVCVILCVREEYDSEVCASSSTSKTWVWDDDEHDDDGFYSGQAHSCLGNSSGYLWPIQPPYVCTTHDDSDGEYNEWSCNTKAHALIKSTHISPWPHLPCTDLYSWHPMGLLFHQLAASTCHTNQNVIQVFLYSPFQSHVCVNNMQIILLKGRYGP